MGTVHRIRTPNVEELIEEFERKAERLAMEFLHTAPAAIVACHGFGHAFPKPTDKRTRKYFQLMKDSSGWSQLNMVCRDCGMIRYVIAEPGVVISLPAQKYGYLPPKGYKPPKGAGKYLPKRTYANEAMRRYYEEQKHPTGGELMPRFEAAGELGSTS